MTAPREPRESFAVLQVLKTINNSLVGCNQLRETDIQARLAGAIRAANRPVQAFIAFVSAPRLCETFRRWGKDSPQTWDTGSCCDSGPSDMGQGFLLRLRRRQVHLNDADAVAVLVARLGLGIAV